MENKEFRNALVNAMKAEIAQLGNEQREQKKTRKLENRPKEKSLQDIVDEINNRAYKISNLLYYYCWIRHSLKYWANRDVHCFKDFMIKMNHDEQYWEGYYNDWDKVIKYGCDAGKTHGQYTTEHTKNYYIKKCNEYGIEVSEGNVNYLIQNI